MFGFGMAFLMEYLDDTIKSPADINKQELFFLGSVPKLKVRGNLIISGKSPCDPACEAYRNIRNRIKWSCFNRLIKTLLVTSPIAGEGKTITAINLAISMTYEGKKVLLFDANYRKPVIHEVFDLHNEIGATSILAKQADIHEAIQESGIEKLSILTSGPIPHDPARLIESERMRLLINDLSGRFDIVVIDSSSLLDTNDSVVLADIVDGFISITESCRETHLIFNQAREIYELAGVRPIGIVLNKFS